VNTVIIKKRSLIWLGVVISFLIISSIGNFQLTDYPNMNDDSTTPLLISPLNTSTLELRRPTFIWTEIESADKYLLQLDKEDNFSTQLLIEVDDIETNSFTPSTDLTLGRWFWRVKAVNDTGSGPFSQTWEFTVIPPRTAPEGDIPLYFFGIVIVPIILWYSYNAIQQRRSNGAIGV
jgi:hypothetical protein